MSRADPTPPVRVAGTARGLASDGWATAATFAAMEKASSSAMAGYMNRRAAKGAMRRANRAMAMAVIDSTTS